MIQIVYGIKNSNQLQIKNQYSTISQKVKSLAVVSSTVYENYASWSFPRSGLIFFFYPENLRTIASDIMSVLRLLEPFLGKRIELGVFIRKSQGPAIFFLVQNFLFVWIFLILFLPKNEEQRSETGKPMKVRAKIFCWLQLETVSVSKYESF